MYLLDYLIVIRLSECDDMFHPLTSARDSPLRYNRNARMQSALP